MLYLIDSAIKLTTDTLIRMYSDTAQVSFATCSKYPLLDQDSVIKVRYTLVAAVPRVVL